MKGGITYETCSLTTSLKLFKDDESEIGIDADEDYFDTAGLIRYIGECFQITNSVKTSRKLVFIIFQLFHTTMSIFQRP